MTIGQTSFAFDRMGGADWEWYEEHGRKLAPVEILHHAQLVADLQGELARKDFKALIREKLRRATQGLLEIPRDGRDNLAAAHGIMEIKWAIGRAQWRLYYAEPQPLRVSRTMLALHFAQKLDVEQQTASILEAGRRAVSWHAQSAR